MKLTWRTYKGGASLDLMRPLPKGGVAAVRFHWTILDIGLSIEFSRILPRVALNLGVMSFMIWF